MFRKMKGLVKNSETPLAYGDGFRCPFGQHV